MMVRLTIALFTVVAASIFAASPVVAQTAQTAQTAQPAQTTQPPRNAAWWTDAGRILAGDAPNAASALTKVASQPSVQRHRGAFMRSWAQFEASRLKPAMKFAQDEITRQPQAAGPGKSEPAVTGKNFHAQRPQPV